MNYDDYIDAPVYDKDNNKIGSVAAFYYTEDKHTPVWATVKSGLFGLKKHFIPLNDATTTDEGIKLTTLTEDIVKNAPSIEDDDETSDTDDALLRNYYHYETQRENGVDSVEHDSEPMPNVALSEEHTDGESQPDYAESESEPTITRHGLHRYIVREGGRVWDVRDVTDETSAAE